MDATQTQETSMTTKTQTQTQTATQKIALDAGDDGQASR